MKNGRTVTTKIKNNLEYEQPSKAISTSFFVGAGLFLSSVKADMTNPGVQNPHCNPWDSTNLFCKQK